MTATLKQRAYEHIRGQLIAGRLSPGARLCNRTLAKEIGVSLIPVREAISQLVSEGLAEHRPRMGAFVMETGREELKETCRQHEEIIGALRRGDASVAAAMMRDHLRRGCRSALEQFERRRMDEAAGVALLQDQLQQMERTTLSNARDGA